MATSLVAATAPVRTPVTTAGQTVLPAGTGRRMGFSIFNESTTTIVYVKLGAGASITDYTLQIPALYTYEPPADLAYQGPISAITVAGTAVVMAQSLDA